MLWEPWTPEFTADQIAKRVQQTGLDTEPHRLALIIEHEGACIGDAMLTMTDVARKVVEIGWSVHPDHAQKGFATEAAAALLEVAFDTYDVHRVVAQLDARNEASARLCERLGMVKEAHLRQNWWSKGAWTDTLVYAMLSGDRDGDRPTHTVG